MVNAVEMQRKVRSDTLFKTKAMKNGGIIEPSAFIEKYALNCKSPIPIDSSISFWSGAALFDTNELKKGEWELV